MLGGFFVPMKRPAHIRGLAAAFFEHHRHIELGFAVAFVGTHQIPAQGLFLIMGHAVTGFMHIAQLIGSRRIALDGSHHQIMHKTFLFDG